jgi:hypothetical protein
MVSGRMAQLIDRRNRMNLAQLSQSNAFESCVTSAVPMVKYKLSLRVGKRSNHA